MGCTWLWAIHAARCRHPLPARLRGYAGEIPRYARPLVRGSRRAFPRRAVCGEFCQILSGPRQRARVDFAGIGLWSGAGRGTTRWRAIAHRRNPRTRSGGFCKEACRAPGRRSAGAAGNRRRRSGSDGLGESCWIRSSRSCSRRRAIVIGCGNGHRSVARCGWHARPDHAAEKCPFGLCGACQRCWLS